MYYMGFYDLFDHLLEKNNGQDKHTAAAKVSSPPNPKTSRVPGLARTSQNTTPQIIDAGTEAL